MRKRRSLLVALGGLVAVSAMVIPADDRSTQAALPQPPNGDQLTSFVIDGNPDGPNDWDDPYTAPGLTPMGYPTTGMLPANFFPTFSAPDFDNPAATPVENPQFTFGFAVNQFCTDNQNADSEDGWLNPAGQGKLASLRLEDPVIANTGGVVLGCPTGNPQNKTDLLQAYAGYEIVQVPDPAVAGGFANNFIIYAAWRRGLSETGDLNFYLPVSDGVQGPIDSFGQPTNTAGDRVIQFDFDPAGAGSFEYFIWGWNELTTAWELFDDDLGQSTYFDAAVGTGNGAAFGEFALNLTTSGILPDDNTAPCTTVTIAEYAFTGTGNSDEATLQDYVKGNGFPFSNCGSLEVEKTASFTPGTSTDFLFEATRLSGGTMFPAGGIPVTVPPLTTQSLLVDTLSYPQPGSQPSAKVYTDVIAQQDYEITETPLPAGWSIESLECTYKDMFDPILNPDGTPSGDFNTKTTIFDGSITPFAITPVFDSNGDGEIGPEETEAFRTRCVITNTANTVTIVKDAVPDDPTADFSYDYRLGAAPIESFTLNDPTSPSQTFVVTQGETNQFFEANGLAPPFWDFTSVGCDVPQPDDPTGQVVWEQVPGISQVNVTIGVGEPRNVTCTFTNTKRPQPYQILVTPATATNRLTDAHVYTVELRTDSDDDGSLDDLMVGATVDVDWTGPTGSTITAVNGIAITPTDSTTCVTADGSNPLIPMGTCKIAIQSPDNVGSGSLLATFDIPGADAGDPLFPTGDEGTTCTDPTIVGGVITVCNTVQEVQKVGASGNKTWVGYEVDVEPDGTNPLGAEHTFTIDVVRTDGTTETPAAGVTANFGWSGPVGSLVTDVNGVPAPNATSCVTTAQGQCTVTVDSDTNFGGGTITVTSVEGDLVGVGVRTETPTPDSDLTATKTWIDWRVVLAPPTATNAVDQDHEFLLTLERNDGSGWVAEGAGNDILVTWTGPSGSSIISVSDGVAQPNSATCVTAATGQCTVTVSSTDNGTGTLSATSVEVSLGGYTPPGGAAGDPFDFDIADSSATKTWVAVRGTVTPPDATNLAGDPHVFTILVETDDGTGWVPAPEGTVTTFTYGGTAGSVTEVNGVPDLDATSCTLRAAPDLGTCTVTVDSDTPGTGIFTVNGVTSLIVNGEQLVPPDGSIPVADADPSPDVDSRLGIKTWIRYLADVQSTATNVAGDQHVFTLTAQIDNGGTPTAVPDGSTITYTWTGTEPAVPATSCTTTTGACTVTVNSATPGTGTITITGVTANIDGNDLAGTTTSDPATVIASNGGSLTATKTWVEVFADVAPSAINLIGDDHTFTLTATYDDGTGIQPANGATFNYTFGLTGTANPDGTCTAAVDANTCTVTVSSDDPGIGTLEIATIDATINGTAFSGLVPAAASGGSLAADKTWIRYLADVQTTATNIAGDQHVFTLSAQVDVGVTPSTVPNGSTITYTWTGPAQTPPLPGSCTTTGGSCTVTVNSTDATSGTISITGVTATINGTTLTGTTTSTPPTLVAANGGSLTATKTWVEVFADVQTTGTNLTGDDHTFTLTAAYDDGGGVQDLNGATFNYTWSGAGTALPAATCTAAIDANTCTVTVSSNDPGTGTLTINTITTTINGTTFTNITPTPATGGSLTATKTWIAFDVDITPDFDLNAANDPHIFTISVQVDDGSGLVPLPIPPNSGSVDWSFTAPDTSVTTGTCTLVAGGTCTVEQNSAVIGTGVLTATALSVNYGGTDLGPVDLTAAGSGQASALTIPVEATKVWIGYTLTLDPTDALNLWPTQPEHVVTLELTRLPDIPQLPIDDQDLAVTLTSTVATITGVSDGTVDTTTTATCTTDVTGQCQVTITSTGPGAATLSAVYTTNIGNQEASFPAVEDAEKTWRTYRVNVTPTTAENLLGTPHTFTVTVEQTDDGATWTPVENAVPSIDVSSPGIIGTETCSNGTDAAGQCTVDVSSPDTGSVTLTATYEGALNDATSEFSDDGEKTWIDYRVTVTPPTAENLVDTNHTFTVTVEVDRGSGFAPLPDATPTVTRSGVGSITSNTCPAGTDANGTCAVTIRSAAAGNTTVEAEYVGTAGDSDSATYSDSGSKTWLDYRLSVDPREATNSINDPHTFIATLEVDRGSGFGPATGETLDVNAAGVGAIITIDVSGPAASTCTTDAAGTCRITVNSSTGGALTITVSYSAQVGDTADTMSALGTKSWIGGGIPDTGSETGPILRTAAGLMLAGLLLLLVSMRRRTAARS